MKKCAFFSVVWKYLSVLLSIVINNMLAAGMTLLLHYRHTEKKNIWDRNMLHHMIFYTLQNTLH